MIIWTIVVFFLGLFGLLHEVWLVSHLEPILAIGTSVAIMLIALGMFYSQLKHKKK
jgi:hypothetical protein